MPGFQRIYLFVGGEFENTKSGDGLDNSPGLMNDMINLKIQGCGNFGAGIQNYISETTQSNLVSSFSDGHPYKTYCGNIRNKAETDLKFQVYKRNTHIFTLKTKDSKAR